MGWSTVQEVLELGVDMENMIVELPQKSLKTCDNGWRGGYFDGERS